MHPERRWASARGRTSQRAAAIIQPIVLGASHQRALAAGLRHIERSLALVAHRLGSAYEDEVVSMVDDLSEMAHIRLCQRIDLARRLIAEMRETFALEPTRLRKSRWVAARLSAQPRIAEQCASCHLAAYGDFPREAARRLDPLAWRLSDLLLEMQRIALSARPPAGHVPK